MAEKKTSALGYLLLSVLILSAVIFLFFGICSEIKDSNIANGDNFETISKQSTETGMMYTVREKKSDIMYIVVKTSKGVSITPMLGTDGNVMRYEDFKQARIMTKEEVRKSVDKFLEETEKSITDSTFRTLKNRINIIQYILF